MSLNVPPILAIGHSHLACVEQAALATGFELSALNFWTMPGSQIAADGLLWPSGTLKEAIRSHRGPLFSLVGGSSHTVLGALVHPRRFDFVLAEQPDLPIHREAEVLPQNAVGGMLRAHMAGYLNLMLELGKVASGPFHHLESPPPHRDSERMRQSMPWSLFPDMKQEISTAPFRYKMWRLHSAVVRDWCAEHGIAFIPHPRDSVDDEGYMIDACYHDGLHANLAYGKLVIDQIKRAA